ncbi:hypothetical protein [Oceanivirga miroungae]|uniref:Outer membrane protein beta-barrel domain-containing protein n=1 Tax=Oceanivirga miroungae TaxID=1130046 RepID=A0A6I8M711_9FUSO|nr:hypothetical protein [Oceanivirga miroungae]VWL85196.1 hypothetical protein OMES3154_00479 [Oceanivirga miroungae]
MKKLKNIALILALMFSVVQVSVAEAQEGLPVKTEWKETLTKKQIEEFSKLYEISKKTFEEFEPDIKETIAATKKLKVLLEKIKGYKQNAIDKSKVSGWEQDKNTFNEEYAETSASKILEKITELETKYDNVRAYTDYETKVQEKIDKIKDMNKILDELRKKFITNVDITDFKDDKKTNEKLKELDMLIEKIKPIDELAKNIYEIVGHKNYNSIEEKKRGRLEEYLTSLEDMGLQNIRNAKYLIPITELVKELNDILGIPNKEKNDELKEETKKVIDVEAILNDAKVIYVDDMQISKYLDKNIHLEFSVSQADIKKVKDAYKVFSQFELAYTQNLPKEFKLGAFGGYSIFDGAYYAGLVGSWKDLQLGIRYRGVNLNEKYTNIVEAKAKYVHKFKVSEMVNVSVFGSGLVRHNFKTKYDNNLYLKANTSGQVKAGANLGVLIKNVELDVNNDIAWNINNKATITNDKVEKSKDFSKFVYTFGLGAKYNLKGFVVSASVNIKSNLDYNASLGLGYKF